jgi:hypothetical protein
MNKHTQASSNDMGTLAEDVSVCTIFDGERIANRDGEGCWSFRMRD